MVVYHNLFKDSEDLVDLLKYAKNIKEKEYFLSPWEDWGNLGEIMKNSFNSYFDEKNIFDPKFQKQKKIFDNIVKCYQIVAEDFFKEYKNTEGWPEFISSFDQSDPRWDGDYAFSFLKYYPVEEIEDENFKKFVKNLNILY